MQGLDSDAGTPVDEYIGLRKTNHEPYLSTLAPASVEVVTYLSIQNLNARLLKLQSRSHHRSPRWQILESRVRHHARKQ